MYIIDFQKICKGMLLKYNFYIYNFFSFCSFYEFIILRNYNIANYTSYINYFQQI